MNELKLEAGRCYRTRTGRKRQCLTVSRPNKYGLNAVLMDCESGDVFFNQSNGKICITSVECAGDIISEWVDAPEVDWSLFSPWVDEIFQRCDGVWRQSDRRGAVLIGNWVVNDRAFITDVHPSCYPKYSGPWQQSLVVRPGKEGGK